MSVNAPLSFEGVGRLLDFGRQLQMLRRSPLALANCGFEAFFRVPLVYFSSSAPVAHLLIINCFHCNIIHRMAALAHLKLM